jgi:hypothetical protein
MKLPAYPLRVVEDQRRRLQDAAQELLARRLGELAGAEEELCRATARAEALREERQSRQAGLYAPPAEGELDVARIARRREVLDHLGGRLSAAVAERERRCAAVAAAVRQIEAARGGLTAAVQAVTAIEKHRESWRQGVLAEMRRRDEKLIAEINTSQYVRRGS